MCVLLPPSDLSTVKSIYVEKLGIHKIVLWLRLIRMISKYRKYSQYEANRFQRNPKVMPLLSDRSPINLLNHLKPTSMPTFDATIDTIVEHPRWLCYPALLMNSIVPISI